MPACRQQCQQSTNSRYHFQGPTIESNMFPTGRRLDHFWPFQNNQTNMYCSGNSQFSCQIFPLGQSATLCPRKPVPYCYHYQITLHTGQGIQKIPRNISIKKQCLPPSMYYRMMSIEAVVKAQFAYANNLKIIIPRQATAAVCTIYKYLVNNKPWECSIGHIVPRILV